jgi:hypothetical protein
MRMAKVWWCGVVWCGVVVVTHTYAHTTLCVHVGVSVQCLCIVCAVFALTGNPWECLDIMEQPGWQLGG